MSTVTAGNPVVLDALFPGGVPPDNVVFELELPGSTTQSFSTGDAQVTNPSAGYWECAVGVPSAVGEYRWRATGTAGSGEEVVGTVYGTVFVIPSAVDPAAEEPPGPTLGPCETWITGADVAACVNLDYGSNVAIFDTAAYEASMALYEISGRIFTGLCDLTVRPCAMNCSCWASAPYSSGFQPFWWAGSQYGTGGGWGWYNERAGVVLGCKPTSYVKLAYPTREIVSVRIGGELLLEFDPDTGARQWRLDDWRHLVRMDTPPVAPATTGTPNLWPGCQNMSLDADEPGTFEIVYRWGVTPPALGRSAPIEIAEQIWLACGGARQCVLPAGATKVVRQGITVERQLLANWLDPTKGVGLVSTDLFLQAYAGGQRRGRRSGIYSPDVQQFARPTQIRSGS